MKEFTEGAQVVKFNENDKVIKLDAHRFYHYVSGRGFKGVDFLLINEELGLVLIELKNYVNNSSPEQEQLEEVFFQKCEDTLHLIEIIYKYYQRKFWIRTFVIKFNMNFLLSKETKFWLNAYHLYRQGKVMLLGNFDNY